MASGYRRPASTCVILYTMGAVGGPRVLHPSSGRAWQPHALALPPTGGLHGRSSLVEWGFLRSHGVRRLGGQQDFILTHGVVFRDLAVQWEFNQQDCVDVLRQNLVYILPQRVHLSLYHDTGGGKILRGFFFG